MNKPISQRLTQYIKDKKIDGPAVYQGTDITIDEWSKYTRTSRGIPEHDIVTIVTKLEKLDTRWLVTGIGNMSIEEKNIATEPASPKYINRKIEELNILVAELKFELAKAREDNSTLIKLLYDRQKGECSPGEPKGGVEKSVYK